MQIAKLQDEFEKLKALTEFERSKFTQHCDKLNQKLQDNTLEEELRDKLDNLKLKFK